MAVLKVYLDNIVCFDNFTADFTYPKKLVSTSLPDEYLKGFPNIRYKKVNIIIGSNATGKTSFGRALWHIFLFLNVKEANRITSIVKNKNKDTNILMDYIDANGLFSRIEILVKAVDQNVDVRVRCIQADENDTYEMLIKQLKESEPFKNYLVALENYNFSGWNFVMPSIEGGSFELVNYDNILENDKLLFSDILKKVLITMDQSINYVYPSKEATNSYVIDFVEGESIHISNGGKISEIPKLSSGTKYAVNIANVLYAISKHLNGFYFVDEQFSYVSSEIEIACLSSMVSLLNNEGEQLFFTTHNDNIMKLNLPLHSFNFMSKERKGNSVITKWVNAADVEKRNNVRVKNLYDNDYFDTNPNVNLIFDIGENK